MELRAPAVSSHPASSLWHATVARLRRLGWERPEMKPYKYHALVTLNPPEDGGLDAEPVLHVRHLAVRAFNHETGQGAIFSALVSAADDTPLRPGSAGIIATLEVLGKDLDDYLAPGDKFTLLSGGEVGHGIVSGRLFT